MKLTLFLDWHLTRLGRSAVVALTGSLLVGLALISVTSLNANRREEIDRAGRASTLRGHADRLQRHELDAWRARLAEEEARLPKLANVPALVRAAVANMEAAGVAIDGVSTGTSKVASQPNQVVTLDARLSGTAAKVAAAVSSVLAASPGWATERLTLERRAGGFVSVDVSFNLLARDAQ